jgi:thiamine-monophosphate kinase
VKLAELGEFGLIDRIAQKVGPATGVSLGIGDDAAVTVPTPRMVSLTTTDMLVEGVHFDLSYCDPATLGRKSLAVNLSDLAAMGAIPRHCFLSLAIPPACAVEFIDQFSTALLALAEQHGVSLVGGDTCSSPAGLVVNIALVGEQEPQRVITRRGARPGDLVCVTGTLGDAALGLALLRQGERQGEAVRRQLDPEPRVGEGVALAQAGLPTAMIDISDGLLADLGHILRQSAVGACLELARLPLSPAYRAAFPLLTAADFSLALSGGEDYELLFTIPPHRLADLQALADRFRVPVTTIGAITADHGLRLLDRDGRQLPATSQGFNHFAPERASAG